MTGTRLDVFEAQRSLSSPSWQRLSGKVTYLLQSQFGRVRIPPPLDFDDFTSEVMVVVLRDIGRFEDRGRGSFQAWVHRLAHNRLNDLWRFHDTSRRGGNQGVAVGGDDGVPGLSRARQCVWTAFGVLAALGPVALRNGLVGGVYTPTTSGAG